MSIREIADEDLNTGLTDSSIIKLSKNRSVTIALSGPSRDFPGSAKLTLETYIQLQLKTFTFYVPLGVLGGFIDALLDIEKLAVQRGFLAPDDGNADQVDADQGGV